MKPPAPGAAEFDDFAKGYDAGMNDPLKRLAGDSFQVFMDQKVFLTRQWLARNQTAVSPASELSLLDFGCGAADFLRTLQRAGFAGKLCGSDISAEMLREARSRWPELASVALHATSNGVLPFAADTFDWVTASCVFHHIAPAERPAAVAELRRVLKPGGRLLLFEHNPWNPLTRLIVKRAPIDRNAVLLSAPEAKELMRGSGLGKVQARFFLFVPPRFRWLWQWERWLGWCPLGGQYLVAGQK